MRRGNQYLAIIVVAGSLGLIMTLDSGDLAYLLVLLYVALYLIGATRWLDEYLYYRRWGAPLASSMFVLIPLALSLSGSIIATITPFLTRNVVFFTVELDPSLPASMAVFISYFSLVLLTIPNVIWFVLMQRWIRRRYYPVYVLRRAIHPQLLSFLVLTAVVLFYYYAWREGMALEGTGFITTTSLVILFAYQLITRVLPVSRNRQQLETRSSRMTPARSRSNTSQLSSQVRTSPRRRETSSPRGSGPLTRVRHPNPSNGTTTRARNSRRTTPHVRTTSRRGISSSVHQGHQQRITTSARVRPLLPRTKTLTTEDFNCILCFQSPHKNDEPFVLCPHCHYPAHLSEWQEWHQSTDICSRCNEKIPKSYLKNPKHVVPATVYMAWKKSVH